jgi:hypothetical protein
MWDRDRWSVQASWEAAVFVTARAYQLDRSILGETAAGGRGPRTPQPYWEARKVAIYVAVLAVDCTYAALGRVIGTHRDTVTSQCKDVQERVAVDPMLGRLVDRLERDARNRTLGDLETLALQVTADLEHARALKTDRLPIRSARMKATRGRPRRVNPTNHPTTLGGVESGHGNLIPFRPGPAE